MAEVIKETVSTQSDTTKPVVVSPVVVKVTNQQTLEYLIYFVFGLLEVLLAFRLILKVTGASVASGFVQLMYSLTGLFILPFEGIFRRGFAPGAETTSVLEPSTLVAIVVYAVLAWGIVKLMQILSRQQPTT